MSFPAMDWWIRHGLEYANPATEGALWALGAILTRHTATDPAEGAHPSQGLLADALGVKDRKTIARYTDQLIKRGAITVVPQGGPPTKGRGRRPHLYIFPKLVADAPRLPGTTPRVMPGKSGVAGHDSAHDARLNGSSEGTRGIAGHPGPNCRALGGELPGMAPRATPHEEIEEVEGMPARARASDTPTSTTTGRCPHGRRKSAVGSTCMDCFKDTARRLKASADDLCHDPNHISPGHLHRGDCHDCIKAAIR